MKVTKEDRERWKQNNPTLRLSERNRKFLTAYVMGADLYQAVSVIWPTCRNAPLKIAQILNDEKFQAAYHFLTDSQLTRHALAHRQLLIADRAEKPIEKMHAVRAASQILGHIRNGQGEGSGYKGKTQKNKIPPVPVDELNRKLIALAEKAVDSGHKRAAS